MPGQIKRMIDKIIQSRSKGNAIIINTTITKLTLKGISVTSYSETSPDDADIIAKLKTIAEEMKVTL